MQAAIHAIRDFPHGPAEIHVVPEIDSYSLNTVTIWSNNKNIVVNESVWKSATMAIQDVGKRVEVLTGYGTGGAVATMIAFLLSNNNSRTVSVVTFGSPPIGDRVFNDIAESVVNLTHVKLAGDPVATRGFGTMHFTDATVVGHNFPLCTTLLFYKCLATLGNFRSAYTVQTYIDMIATDDFEMLPM